MPNFSLTSTLWDEVVRTDSRHAAQDFIYDVFEQYVWNELGADDVSSRLQEDLFHILEDNNGAKLRVWLRLFKTDQDHFEVKASAWADLCCELAE